ncbi:RIP metalloprotease RseP [Mucilaginibacter rubeus]|uniref:Zinc metalloprotease n=1 Tax=Mucilaginibacter rubeus TaxID=2027860 RepID=A0AAE6MHW2_9SPHI|nr:MULTISPECIES: RIP metalloprotease RseP [Mucilaginibacter]QEM03664.1 RIP metalloprotease RseP [Mucilaginibacter rubeus]QEM16275.1 RIP metalloprotease RseP [Mucilaginibacter gossypii]QTE40963.1 RIP metalloprotease RseP [Mucilaginibacter rubeus]QTE47566.1 RIP metalloprotease RseP [Mucilaginibacter rubeus]QTE58958.1 RIP metalloprotease RseP [Mucilaginibacter rubeus]
MSILIMITQFLAGLSLLVFIHELGHFLAARAFGIRIKKFYLFFDAFDKRLYRYNYKGTEFGIGWLPFGGYVRMAGSLTAVDEDEADEDAEVPQGQLYGDKPVWQRLIVMSAGIAMNLCLALIIYCGIFLYYGRNQVTAIGRDLIILPGELGLQAGLQPGDEVTSINADSSLYEDELLSTHLMRGNTVLSIVRHKGKEKIHMHVAVSPKIMQLVADKGLTQFFSIKAGFQVDSIYTNIDLRHNQTFKKSHIVALNGDYVQSYNDFIIRLKENKQRQLYLTVIHDGKTSTMLAHQEKDGHIGFSVDNKLPLVKPQRITLSQSLSAGTNKVWNTISENSSGLSQLVSGEVKANEGLVGPVRIATLFSGNFEPKRFWELVALLSTALALFNVIPLPPMDGGILLLLIYEGFTRKPVSRTFWAFFSLSGLVIILLLSGYVLFNDIRTLNTMHP